MQSSFYSSCVTLICDGFNFSQPGKSNLLSTNFEYYWLIDYVFDDRLRSTCYVLYNVYLANNLFEKLFIHDFTWILVTLKEFTTHDFNPRTTPPCELLSKWKRETYGYVVTLLCCELSISSKCCRNNDSLQNGRKGKRWIKMMVVKRHRFFLARKS